MGTKHPELFAALVAPFSRDEVKSRSQVGRTFSYVTARVIMNRLDEVLGPENWSDHYIPGDKSVVCVLTIILPDGVKLVKEDAGGYAGMSDSGDDEKSGFSDAFKRAAVKIGVSRYLYGDGIPSFGNNTGVMGGLPDGDHVPSRHVGSAPASSCRPIPAGQQPTSGKGLWAWASNLGTETGTDVISMVLAWGKDNGSAKVTEWDIGTVSECFTAVAGRLDELGILKIPDQARYQMLQREKTPVEITKASGPLTLFREDRLFQEKTEIVKMVRTLAGRSFGTDKTMTEVAAMAWLDLQAVRWGMPVIKDLRNFSDRKSIDRIMMRLLEDLEESNRLS